MSSFPVSLQGRRLATVTMAVALVVALYWPALQSLALVWLDTNRTTYTHGFLVAAICLWLGWRVRGEFALPDDHQPRPAERVFLLVALLAAVLLWQFLYRAGIQIGAELLLMMVLALLLLAAFGRRALRAAALPLGYLLFAVPLWDALNPTALWLTTHAVQLLLRTFSIPAHFSGNNIQVPAGEFEIAGGCSGLHYLIVALALAVLMGEVRRDGWRLRLRWCLIAVLAALVLNWIRVFALILVGHLTNMQHYLVKESHYGFGWVLFLTVVVTLFVAERFGPAPEAPPRGDGREPGGTVERPANGWRLAAAAVIALPFGMNALVNARSDAHSPWVSGMVLADVPGCIRVAGLSAWQPRQALLDEDLREHFQCGGVEVETYSAWYGEQRMRKKLGGDNNRLEGDHHVVSSRIETVAGRSFMAQQLEDGGKTSLLWKSYRVAGREFTDAMAAQFWYSLSTMRTLSSPGSLAVAIRASCDTDCSAARTQLESFVANGGVP